jgi:hypothetical protein
MRRRLHQVRSRQRDDLLDILHPEGRALEIRTPVAAIKI